MQLYRTRNASSHCLAVVANLLQALSAQRELQARELRHSAEESARLDPCPSITERSASRDVPSFAEPAPPADCYMEEPEVQVPAATLMLLTLRCTQVACSAWSRATTVVQYTV